MRCRTAVSCVVLAAAGVVIASALGTGICSSDGAPPPLLAAVVVLEDAMVCQHGPLWNVPPRVTCATRAVITTARRPLLREVVLLVCDCSFFQTDHLTLYGDWRTHKKMHFHKFRSWGCKKKTSSFLFDIQRVRQTHDRREVAL